MNTRQQLESSAATKNTLKAWSTSNAPSPLQRHVFNAKHKKSAVFTVSGTTKTEAHTPWIRVSNSFFVLSFLLPSQLLALSFSII